MKIEVLGSSNRVVPGAGPKSAKIAIVGEAPGAYEDMQLRPFVGPAGAVLEQCLHAAGLIRSEVYLTNVVKVRPPKNDISPYFSSSRGTFTAAGMEWVELLREEINGLGANVLVACGATAMAALTGRQQVMKYRGYVTLSIGLKPQRKVIPCIHPSAALRGMYIYRHLITADLKKAKQESASPQLERPERQLIYDFESVDEVLRWLDYFHKQPILSVDVEVTNYELACIGLSSHPAIAISVPLVNSWSEGDELLIWRGLQKVLENPASIKVMHNAMFDVHFLLTRCGIKVQGPIRDTMIAHSIMYPELQKSLAFLGSIYCGSQPYWKDAIKFTSIKEEE